MGQSKTRIWTSYKKKRLYLTTTITIDWTIYKSKELTKTQESHATTMRGSKSCNRKSCQMMRENRDTSKLNLASLYKSPHTHYLLLQWIITQTSHQLAPNSTRIQLKQFLRLKVKKINKTNTATQSDRKTKEGSLISVRKSYSIHGYRNLLQILMRKDNYNQAKDKINQTQSLKNFNDTINNADKLYKTLDN